MLKRLKLSNFKCFENLDMSLAPLTLLSGLNGMGKSSVIQSLLVLRQSIIAKRNEIPDELILSGDITDLRTGADVLFEDAQNSTIRIEIHHDNIPTPYGLSFEYVGSADRLLTNSHSEPHDGDLPNEWLSVPPFGRDLIYVNAERIGPRKHYPLSDTAARRGDIGSRGEFALNYWNSRKDHVLHDNDPRNVGHSTRKLSAILECWLDSVIPGAHLWLDTVPDADALLARFSFDRPRDVETRPYCATNVSFGLSYSLPVLITLLAPPGTLCLIENPEAHLHPQGQTKLAELAVLASNAGLQIIVETHSDHFLDGVRVAVHDNLILPEQVAIHYFERIDGKTVVSSPIVDSDGRLSSWPSGFFDQHDNNLVKLLVPKP